MHVRRLLFDHRDVSDAEHRLVMRGGGRGPEFGGSAGDARENMFRQYEANIRANAEIEKEGMKPSYKRFVDRETDRKIAEARARFNNDRTFLDIRNVQDAHQASHLLFARARSAVVEGNSIDSTPAGIKAARDARLKILYEQSDRRVNADIALMRKEIAEGKSTWQMTYFHEMPLQGQQQALANAVRRGETVPDEVLKDHQMTREGIEDRSAARSAEVFLSSNRPNTTEFQPRSPGSRTIEHRDVDSRSDEFVERYEERNEKLQKYIRDQDHSLNAEIKSTLQRATLLRDGPQKDALMRIIDKYRAKRYEWGESTTKQGEEIRRLFDPSASPLDVPEHLRKAVQRVPTFEQPYFASQIIIAGRARIELPKMISDLQAEVRAVIEQNKQQTGEKVAEFIVLRRKWDAVDGTDLSPVAIRKVGEELITSIDALGSHLYVNHVQEGVAEEENAAFIADVQQRLVAKGVPAVDEEDMKLLTPDRQGMRHMLVVKNEVLQQLCKNQEDDVLLRRRLVAALARTERTFIEHGGSKEEIEEVNAQRALAEFQMASLSQRATFVATLNPDPAKPGEGLAAAQRERFVLEELLSNPDVDRHVRENLEKRLGELKRSPEALGIIGEECFKVLDPLRTATDALAIDTLATSEECIAAMVTIRAEGQMLWKLQSDLHPEMVQRRVSELVTMQCDVIKKQWNIERAAAGDDVRAIGEAIVRSVRSLSKLRSSSLNNEAVNGIHEKLSKVARAMRGPVNAAILAAKSDKPLKIERVQSAVEMIVAEERALRALDIDGDRVDSIRKELALIDDLGKDVEAKVTEQKKASSPDLSKFKEMSALLYQEDTMVRAVFSADPERLAKRITSIEAQRASLMKSFTEAVDAAVKNLDEKISTPEQVRKASELLEEAFRQKGGDRMSDVQELARFQVMRKKVDAVRAAADKRLSQPPSTPASQPQSQPPSTPASQPQSQPPSTPASQPQSQPPVSPPNIPGERVTKGGGGDGTSAQAPMDVPNLNSSPMPSVDASEKIPKTIGGYPVTLKPSGDIVLSRDGYELHIRATTDPTGYYLWDGSDDGYHITSIEGTSIVPNQDPLGFFGTLPAAIAALEATVGTKNVVDKMKEWKERNEQAMEKLATYFDADSSPTKARGWMRRGLNFYGKGESYVIASIDFLRRDDNFLRFSRQSDVGYGDDQKTYASVESLLADVSEFLKARELPSLASTLDHESFTGDDRRVLEGRFEECVALPTEMIIELLKKLRSTSNAQGGEWANPFRYRLLPRVATKDSRLLQAYASTLKELQNSGLVGIPESFTVDIQKAAKEIAAAKSNDGVTLRECGAVMEFAGNREAAKQLFERSFELDDLTAGILLVHMHSSSPSEALRYAKRCLVLAKEQGKDKVVSDLNNDIAGWEKEASAQPESTKQNGATPKGVSSERGGQEEASVKSSPIPSVEASSPESSMAHTPPQNSPQEEAPTPEAFPVTSASSEVHAVRPSEPSSDVPTLAEYVRSLQIELAAARVLFQQIEQSHDPQQIDRISAQLKRLSRVTSNVSDGDYVEIKEQLQKKMQDLLVERGTPDDLRRAVEILKDRYGPAIESLDDRLSIETHAGLSRQLLLAELDGPNGLLQKSQKMNIEDVQRPLMEIRRKIQLLKDRPELTEEEFAAEIKADLARRIPITPDQIGMREASMVAAESAVAMAETLAQAPSVAIPQLEQALKALVESDRQANDFDPEESSNRFKAWHERKPAAQEKLSQRLFAACLESPTRKSVARASQIFIGRYKQFQVESAHNVRRLLAKESDALPSADPFELRKELMGDGTPQNTGLLSKAVSFNLSDKVIRELRSIEKDLRPYSSSSYE